MRVRTAILLLAAAASLAPQSGRNPRHDVPGRHAEPETSVRLPGGRNQSEEILKADHAKSLEDAAQLLKLSEELKIELEKNDRHVLSIPAIKKTEEIEKLAKRIRARMKRF